MAGSGDSQDNPVGINVVPMVDVIFCLCVFFMCSFRFQEREGRIETWLPKDLGYVGTPDGEPRELRVALFWDELSGVPSRRFGWRTVKDDRELEGLLQASLQDYEKRGERGTALVVDSDPRVPWSAVLDVVDMGRALAIENVRFAASRGPE